MRRIGYDYPPPPTPRQIARFVGGLALAVVALAALLPLAFR